MLELKNISKVFPGVRALNQVSLSFRPGEVHALLGENGAGKSTLIKIICGIYQPDEGEILMDGTKVRFRNYGDAVSHSISIVNQEIQIIPLASIAENIMLDKLHRYARKGAIDWKRLREDARHYMQMVGLDLPPETETKGLSAAQKQMVQIAKALASEAKVLLLDEPTSSLTCREIDVLFDLVRKLREKGVALIFVSHKLEEVMELCDCVSVLRDGKFIGTERIGKLTKQDIIRMMIGRETRDVYMGQLPVDDRTPVLETKNLTRYGKIHDASIRLYRGEILGFYGLVGSGRTELAKTILGEDRLDAGEVLVNGKSVHIRSMFDALHRYHIGYVSENRKEEGLILSESVRANIGTTIWRNIAKCGIINLREERRIAQDMVDAFSIKATSLRQEVGNLSGGNQQKVSISKWMAAGCDILIVDEPSVGVDVGAKEAIHRIIWNLAKEEGKSIILISSDMPELIKLSRRILVFRDNRIAGEITGLNDREHPYEEVSTQIGAYLA